MILIPNLKKECQQKSKQTNNNKKQKPKKNKSFFFTTCLGVKFFFNVRLFMKESAVFTRDEPKASKGMQA